MPKLLCELVGYVSDQYERPIGEIMENTTVPDAFGTLERVSARAGWPHEAHEFTPWLAENVSLLGEALGLSLELQAREHKVGRYSLDLLLSDSAERTVIVENQFEQTDHDHLGKLLTYCAGTEADVVIWIAERLNEEHAAVLEWLNENTRAGIGFFGVELELLRIDKSPLAPNFRVLVQPNDWAKGIRPTAAPSVDWDWAKYRDDLKIPDSRLEVGRALADQLEKEIAGQGVPWTIHFRKGYLALLRPGGYRVAIVDLYWKQAPRFAVRLPDTPEALGFPSPYPNLNTSWDAAENMWGWTIPSITDVPHVGTALAVVESLNPETGPMTMPG
jgi:hypothetical protein